MEKEAGLFQHMIQITRGPEPSTVSPNYVALGPMPAAEEANPRKGGVRFYAYPDRPASEIAHEYVTLCQRFADDFETRPRTPIWSETMSSPALRFSTGRRETILEPNGSAF